MPSRGGSRRGAAGPPVGGTADTPFRPRIACPPYPVPPEGRRFIVLSAAALRNRSAVVGFGHAESTPMLCRFCIMMNAAAHHLSNREAVGGPPADYPVGSPADRVPQTALPGARSPPLTGRFSFAR